jgi:hypothetical protein
MTNQVPELRITGDEEDVANLEQQLGERTVHQLALLARRYDVMISLTITPFNAEDDDDQTGP